MDGNNVTSDKLDLSTYTPRTRHLKSLCIRNLSYECKDVNDLNTYFTLHKLVTSPAFYKSEELRATLNPTWKSFDLSFISSFHTASHLVCLRVWVRDDESNPPKVHIECDVDLRHLVLCDNQDHSQACADDSDKPAHDIITFSMFDAWYELPAQSSSSIERPECLYWDTNLPSKQSYSKNLLARLQVVLRALKQTEQSVERVREDIERQLIEIQNITEKKERVELYKVRLEAMRLRSDKTKQALLTKRTKLYSRRSDTNKKENEIEVGQKEMQEDDSQFTDLRSDHINNREKILKANALLSKRQKQMVYELNLIYPIEQMQDGRYTIAGVCLPNPESISSQNELANSTALGHCVHMIQMLSKFLEIPLEYPMEYRGSRSLIFDMVRPANQISSALQKDRSLPLYTRSKDKRMFQFGVYLLNKNIEQLRYASGLNTKDRKLTLRNLRDFLQMKFDVGASSQTVNAMSVSPPPRHQGIQRTSSVPAIKLHPQSPGRPMSKNDFGSERYSTHELPSTEESSEEAPAVEVRRSLTAHQAPAANRHALVESPVTNTINSEKVDNGFESKDVVDNGKLNGNGQNGVANSNSDQSETETKSKSGSASSNSVSMPFDSEFSSQINNPSEDIIVKTGDKEPSLANAL